MKRYELKSVSPAPSGLDLQNDLNEEQRAVVTADGGPMLVIAGAGTGKTHTLTWRVAWLVDQGVPRDRILLLTFTNKASRQMLERVENLVGISERRIIGGTFHSVGNRLLREYADRLGFSRGFTILDVEDQKTLMSQSASYIAEQLGEKRLPRGKTLVRILSHVLNTRTDLEEYLESSSDGLYKLVDPIREIFRLYIARKLELSAMDYDDLLLQWLRLLSDVPDVSDEIRSRFDVVLVDEYQDTNSVQGELVDRMAADHRNLMVVGDDCQSIYAFRGADYRNILEFPKRWEDCRTFTLEVNYRSTPEILRLANESIAHNPSQFPKNLRPVAPPEERPAFLSLKDAGQQAAFVCQRVLELVDDGISLNEMAVLYRNHSHSMELQVALTRAGIPFVVRSGIRFFEQAHIKDVLCWLRWMYNPRDELSFLRWVRHVRGVGSRRSEDLWMWTSAHEDPISALSTPQAVDAAGTSHWEKIQSVVLDVQRSFEADDPAAMIEAVVAGPYRQYVQDHYERSENRLEEIEQLARYASQFEGVEDFLSELNLLSSAGEDVLVSPQTQEDEYLTLSSIHQAKGLEWSAVFVLGLSEAIFPSSHSLDDEEEMEEERRLFYVAITRARRLLHLLSLTTTFARDGRMLVLRESQFIRELRHGKDVDNPFETWVIA